MNSKGGVGWHGIARKFYGEVHPPRATASHAWRHAFRATIAGAILAIPAARAVTTADITQLNTTSSTGATSSQTVPGGGSGGFPANVSNTLNYNGAIDRIFSYTSNSILFKPTNYPGNIATTLVRVPNPAFVGNQANNNNIIYSRLNSNAGTTYNLNAPFIGNEQTAFNENNLNYGTDNLFGNTGDSNGNNNNVERLDVVFRKGLLATSALAFAIIERGAANGHDPFGIAAVTAVDSQGRPTAYGPLVRFGAGTPYGTYGTTPLVPATADWLVSRNAVADQGALATDPTALVSNQSLGAISIAVTGGANALGVAAGSVVFGYSLFGGDVTGTGGQSLLDPSTFPLNSSSVTGAGGIDLIGYTGVVFEAAALTIEIPSLVLPDKVDLQIPDNLVITTGDILVADGTARISEGSITTPGDLTLNPGGGGGTLIADTPIAAAGDANLAGGKLVADNSLTAVGDVNVAPSAALEVNPTGSVSAGKDVTLTDANVDVAGKLDAGNDLTAQDGAILDIAPTGSVAAGEDVTLSDAKVDVAGKLDAGGDLIADQGTTLTIDPAASVSADKDVTLSDAKVDVAGKLDAGGDLIADQGTTLTIAPAASVSADKDVTLADADVVVAGDLNAGANLNVDSGTTLAVVPGGSVAAGGDVNVADSNVVIQGDLTADGALNLDPGAAVIIDSGGSAVANGGATINDLAMLTVDGQLATPQGGITTITPGGQLDGNGSIDGNVINRGTVTPGNAVTNTPGDLVIHGNFDQTDTGILRIPVGPTDGPSQLFVDGTATLAGTLQLTPANGVSLNFGQTIPSFLVAGNVVGDFTRIELPAGFRGRLLENDGTLSILVAPRSYTEVAQTQNQKNVAGALDSFIAAKSGDPLTVSTALDQLSSGQYPAALDAISPAFYQTIGSIGLSLANTQSLLIDQRLDAVRLGAGTGYRSQGVSPNVPLYSDKGDGKSLVSDKKTVLPIPLLAPDTRWGAWTMANGIFGRSYTIADIPNYHFASGQFLSGVDARWNDHVSTGLFAGYQGAEAHYPGSGSARMNGVTFGTYATYDAGNGFYGSAIATGGYSNYRTSRPIEFGSIDRTARADLDGGTFSAFLKSGYDFKAGGFTFGPVLSAQYTYLGVAPFTESGAGSLDLQVDRQNLNSLQSYVGGRVAYTWSLGDGNVLLIPELRMFWTHEYLQNSTSISSSFDGGSGPGFDYRTSNPSRDSIFAGVGLIAQIGPRWNASVFYNTDFASATGNTQIVSASVGFRW